VTGKWAVGQDAEELLNLDKEDEEEVSFSAFRLSGIPEITSLLSSLYDDKLTGDIQL
jgi:hypothetical protein